MTCFGDWGRSHRPSPSAMCVTHLTLLFTPILVYYFLPDQSVVEFLGTNFSLVLTWIMFQYLLSVLPNCISGYYYIGGKQVGQITPAGNHICYNINGLQAWFISNALFVGGAILGMYRLSVIAEYWGQIFVTANIIGYSLAIIVYFKANFAPDHHKDCKTSGNIVYDIFMGIEFNPSFAGVDLKLFFNGRPGIIAWTMINLSFAVSITRICNDINASCQLFTGYLRFRLFLE